MEELDLTNAHLPSLAEVTISPALKELDLTANRLAEVDPRIIALTGLRSLNFRQNLLTDVSSLSQASFKESMEDLEVRDNHLTEIPNVEGFNNMRRFEFSYNQVRDGNGPPAQQCSGADTSIEACTIWRSLGEPMLKGLRFLVSGPIRFYKRLWLHSFLFQARSWLWQPACGTPAAKTKTHVCSAGLSSYSVLRSSQSVASTMLLI